MDHWTENYCGEENNFFSKNNCVVSLFTFFEKVREIYEFRF